MTLKLNGSTSGSVSIDAPASTTGGADVAFKLPVADGSSGQAMTTNASGQLAFSNVVGGPAFRVGSTTQSNPSASTWTKVQLDTEIFDTHNYFDSSASNYWFKPTGGTWAGYYLINTHVISSTGTNGHLFAVDIKKNGTTFSGHQKINEGHSDWSSSTLTDLVYLDGVDDYIEWFFFHNDSGLDIRGDGTPDGRNTSVSGIWLRA